MSAVLLALAAWVVLNLVLGLWADDEPEPEV
jgi:hypothetical protein